MEVTRKNFREVFDIFREKLRGADFVSIDGEFTGLSTLRGPRFSYDTLEEKYNKAKTGSNNFLIIQFGICLFTWNEEKNCYVAFPFTFCLFPRPYKRFLNDVLFTCQSSSLDFLASHGFDFNKLFYDGISFLHPTTETKAKEMFHKRLNSVVAKEKSGNQSNEINHATLKAKDETKIFIPKDQREFIGNIMISVQQFLVDTSISQCDLPPCSPFQRKLIYEVLEENYPMGLYLQGETNKDKKKFIRVIKVNDTSSKLKNQEEQQRETCNFEEILGFTNVIKLLSEEKKPVIGHNMFLDLFFSITNFFAEAPDNLSEFKSLITTLFPSIFDTKLMASIQPLSNNVGGTSLKQLTECIGAGLPSIKVAFDEVIDEDNKEGSSFHNAGFDAFSTGQCFISLVNCLSSCSESQQVGRIDVSATLMEPFKNCIYIMGIQDIRYMHLSKCDKPPCRKGVFLINFPDDWKETELHNLFSPICKLRFPIVWKSTTSAYVSLSDKEKHDEVISTFISNRNNMQFQVIPFEDNKETPLLGECGKSISKKRKHSRNKLEDGELSSNEEDENISSKTKKQQLFDLSKEW